MSDIQFLKNPVFQNWVILAPRRAKRPDVADGLEPRCPFCPGNEAEEKEVYRIPVISSRSSLPAGRQELSGTKLTSLSVDQTDKQKTVKQSSENRPASTQRGEQQKTDNWLVRVIPNKFPFAPIHEVIIHSPDHHANFGELPEANVELLLQTYRHRYNEHAHRGQVYIFHNRGEAAGESMPHPHSQLVVLPDDVRMDIPRLDPSVGLGEAPRPLRLGDRKNKKKTYALANMVGTAHFYIFCPRTSQWPDEVWIAPKRRGTAFGETTDTQVKDLAHILTRAITIFDLRHGHEFPFNFYIYPGGDWYLRIIPRLKRLGGFEIGTGIFVNTQDPLETLAFIKEHFHEPKKEKIASEHKANYPKSV